MAAREMTVELGGARFIVTPADTDAARELAARLPIDLDMAELNGNEKYAYLDDPLPVAAESPERIEAGDVMLFGDDCLVLFYEGHRTSYRYTRIGRIEDASGLSAAVGGGSVHATWSL